MPRRRELAGQCNSPGRYPERSGRECKSGIRRAYDRSGRVLVFALMADRVPSAGMLDEAADAINAAASALAGCGCR